MGITLSEEVDKSLLRGVFAEFLAMTLFVYVGTGSVVSTGEFLRQDEGSWEVAGTATRIAPISFAFGMSIMVLAYAFGHISGGHINPAVTFCLTLTNQCSVVRGSLYVLAQLVGATLGSLLLWASCSNLKNADTVDGGRVGVPPFNLGVNGLNPNLNQGNGFVYEMMGTLLLCFTVMMTAVHQGTMARGQPNNAPIAIGFAVFLAHIVLIPYTGCGINPARTFGPALVNTFAGVDAEKAWSGNAFWIYWIGPLAGASIAAGIYLILFACDAEQADEKDSANTKGSDQEAPGSPMDAKEVVQN